MLERKSLQGQFSVTASAVLLPASALVTRWVRSLHVTNDGASPTTFNLAFAATANAAAGIYGASLPGRADPLARVDRFFGGAGARLDNLAIAGGAGAANVSYQIVYDEGPPEPVFAPPWRRHHSIRGQFGTSSAVLLAAATGYQRWVRSIHITNNRTSAATWNLAFAPTATASGPGIFGESLPVRSDPASRVDRYFGGAGFDLGETISIAGFASATNVTYEIVYDEEGWGNIN